MSEVVGSQGGASPYRVLVVCTGNICRSPMAERILAHELTRVLGPSAGAIEVTSAGTYPGHAGEPMQPGAAAVMGERGIAYADFRATALTEQLVEAHDLVLTAERTHRAAVVRLNPVAVHRTFTLLEFGRLLDVAATREHAVDAGPDVASRMARLAVLAGSARGMAAPPERPQDDDVEDPYGMPVEEFRRCAARIDDAIAPLLRSLA